MRIWHAGVLMGLLVVAAAWYLDDSGSKQAMPRTGSSSDTTPDQRIEWPSKGLLNDSGDLPVLNHPWSQPIITDEPSHMVVDRVHGGITPGQGSLPAGN